jgi:hypothetical protein
MNAPVRRHTCAAVQISALRPYILKQILAFASTFAPPISPSTQFPARCTVCHVWLTAVLKSEHDVMLAHLLQLANFRRGHYLRGSVPTSPDTGARSASALCLASTYLQTSFTTIVLPYRVDVVAKSQISCFDLGRLSRACQGATRAPDDGHRFICLPIPRTPLLRRALPRSRHTCRPCECPRRFCQSSRCAHLGPEP